MSEPNKILILGNGPCAHSIAEDILAKGDEIIIAVKENDADFPSLGEKAEILTGTTLLSCRGAVGNFNLTLIRNGERISRISANIIIAEEAVRKPNFSLYGLSPSSNIISLSRIRELLSDASDREDGLSKMRKIAFLTGLARESNPVILEEIMRYSLDLQPFNIQTYILTKNLKVGENKLEALYRRTKDAGAVYIKFTDTLPEIRCSEDGSVTLLFNDEIMRKKFSLKLDMLVADETISPSDYAGKLAAIFEIDTDMNGFVQADNVHRISVFTNRKGILVAGPSRSVQSPKDEAADTGNAVLSSLNLRSGSFVQTEDKAEINSGLCARCLTCYRSCPYRAIAIADSIVVMPEACEQCGICAAVCPGRAITIKGLTRDEISSQMVNSVPREQETFVPFLVAFCCKRSASQAGELASCMGHPLPQSLNIIKVPCAGGISHDHIFSALDKADGVLILTCHEGNCHSEYGNLYATKRAEQITNLLSNTGFEKERIAVRTLASNMAKEFAEITDDFEKKIIELGPGRSEK